MLTVRISVVVLLRLTILVGYVFVFMVCTDEMEIQFICTAGNTVWLLNKIYNYVDLVQECCGKEVCQKIF